MPDSPIPPPPPAGPDSVQGEAQRIRTRFTDLTAFKTREDIRDALREELKTVEGKIEKSMEFPQD